MVPVSIISPERDREAEEEEGGGWTHESEHKSCGGGFKYVQTRAIEKAETKVADCKTSKVGKKCGVTSVASVSVYQELASIPRGQPTHGRRVGGWSLQHRDGGEGLAESIINPIPTGQANRGHVSAVSTPHPHLSLIIPHSFLWPGSACSMEAFLTAVPWVRSPQCRGQVCMSIFDTGRAACLSES